MEPAPGGVLPAELEARLADLLAQAEQEPRRRSGGCVTVLAAVALSVVLAVGALWGFVLLVLELV